MNPKPLSVIQVGQAWGKPENSGKSEGEDETSQYKEGINIAARGTE